MPALVLDLLKYFFLIVLYIFVARAVRAVYIELRGASPATNQPASAPARAPARRGKKAPKHIAIIEGAMDRGKSLELKDELTIGRSNKCNIVLGDSYVSQVHARVFQRGDAYVVEDLGSTNGTYLNGKRLLAPAEVQRGDRIKMGKTVLELKR